MPLEDGPAPTGEDAGREQADSANRPSRVEQPVAGPSNTSQRQGFCSYCQVLYNSVEQHVLSTRHRELVGRAARTNVASGSLMQRFLQDVLQHHPHRYDDTRPTHADLPCLNTLPSPREVLSEVYCGSEDDGLSVGTREELPSSDEESCPVVEAQAITTYTSQSQEQAETSTAAPISTGAETRAQTTNKTVEVKLEHSFPEKYSPTQGFLHRTSGDCAMLKEFPQTATVASEQPRSVKSFVQSGSPKFRHRKAHRKTNKHREDSDSCAGHPASPAAKCITSEAQHGHSVEETAVRLIVLQPLKGPPSERAFSEQSDHIREVIEEVIERHCYGHSPKPHQQEEESVFHLSLPSINESKDSEEWDNALLGGLEKNNPEDKHLACLMQVNIHVEDQEYKAQLDTALNTVEQSLPIEPEVAIENTAEEIIPDLPHIPPSFVGKTWTQVMFEDDLKIERMVKEFRQGQFRCYFDSEPRAKSGKRGRKGKKCIRQKKVDATECQDVLPLMEHHEEETKHLPTFRKTRRRFYRMASRCQVVKVSHGTQTAPLNCPVVRRSLLPETLHSNPEPRKDPSPERTPDMKTRLCALKLPASYCKIMSPLQPKTVVYVLASPDGAQGSFKPTPIKRIGRKRKSSDEECMLKYKYKKTPLKYYDPQTNRILKTPPRGVPSTPKNKSASHIRQLFRSLSPDINKELHGSVRGRSPRGSRKSRGEGSLADLCASTSGSCLDSGGPSEPGSSLTSSRKALFSRSSISTSSHFLLGHTSWAASLTDSSSRAKAHSRADSSLSVAGSKLEEDHAQAQADTPPVRRRKQGPRVTEKPLTPAKKPPAPPYRTKRKSKARAKSRNVLERRAAGCRVSPRNKASTRASPRLSGSFQLDL